MSRDECPLQLQMEWPNFYGRRFELRWRSSHVVNVRTQIRGLPSTIRPMQITAVTPCSTLIAVAAHAFQLPDWCKELKIVAVHTKNKSERLIIASYIANCCMICSNLKLYSIGKNNSGFISEL